MSGAVVLVGLSGSGKSTVGRLLAATVDLPFRDTDRIIEARAGRTIADIFGQDGEDVFRDLEQETLTEACASPAVVAVGGGAVLREPCRRAMRRGNLVIWLDVPLDVLIQRLSAHERGERRPLLDGDLAARMRRLRETRRPLYAAAAHLRIGGAPAAHQRPRRIAEMLSAIVVAWRGARLPYCDSPSEPTVSALADPIAMAGRWPCREDSR